MGWSEKPISGYADHCTLRRDLESGPRDGIGKTRAAQVLQSSEYPSSPLRSDVSRQNAVGERKVSDYGLLSPAPPLHREAGEGDGEDQAPEESEATERDGGDGGGCGNGDGEAVEIGERSWVFAMSEKTRLCEVAGCTTAGDVFKVPSGVATGVAPLVRAPASARRRRTLAGATVVQ